MYTLAFWKAAFERILASFAGGLLAVMTLDGFNLAQADWTTLLVGGGTAALVSLLKAIIAGATGNGSPSLNNAEELPASPVANPADRVPGPDHVG
jgi:Putative lactococcus lactis phage r1t holin